MAFTYFFRDVQTLEVATKYLISTTVGYKYIRIWDAGCAMGHEPYSLTIMLAEKMGEFAFRNIRIKATDIDGSNLFGQIIASGVYPEEQLKRIPRKIFSKYFISDEKPEHFKIIDKIRNRIFFQKHDLLSLQPIGNDFSLVVCKNVLLHFRQEERIEVIKMFHRALVDGGFFVTEQTQELPKEVAHLFEQVTSNVQLFRKVGVQK